MTTKRISSRRAVLLGAVIALMAAGAFVAQRAGSNSAMPSTRANQSKPVVEHRQLVRVWVHPEDIYPDVIEVRPGKILFKVENESQTEVSLILERAVPGQASQSVTRLRASQSIKRTGEELAVGTGEYFFYEETRPEIKGRIIVKPE